MKMSNILQNMPYEYFERDNEIGKADKYRLSEWTPYKLSAIERWIEIRDEYTFTDEESDIYYGDWEQLDIAEYHTKYGTNYIYIDHERKLWRLRTSADEFYNHVPTTRKDFDVHFKPKSSAVVCVRAYNESFARKVFEDVLHNMSKEELIDRIISAMESDGYEMEITSVKRV